MKTKIYYILLTAALLSLTQNLSAQIQKSARKELNECQVTVYEQSNQNKMQHPPSVQQFCSDTVYSVPQSTMYFCFNGNCGIDFPSMEISGSIGAGATIDSTILWLCTWDHDGPGPMSSWPDSLVPGHDVRNSTNRAPLLPGNVPSYLSVSPQVSPFALKYFITAAWQDSGKSMCFTPVAWDSMDVTHHLHELDSCFGIGKPIQKIYVKAIHADHYYTCESGISKLHLITWGGLPGFNHFQGYGDGSLYTVNINGSNYFSHWGDTVTVNAVTQSIISISDSLSSPGIADGCTVYLDTLTPFPSLSVSGLAANYLYNSPDTTFSVSPKPTGAMRIDFFTSEPATAGINVLDALGNTVYSLYPIGTDFGPGNLVDVHSSIYVYDLPLDKGPFSIVATGDDGLGWQYATCYGLNNDGYFQVFDLSNGDSLSSQLYPVGDNQCGALGTIFSDTFPNFFVKQYNKTQLSINGNPASLSTIDSLGNAIFSPSTAGAGTYQITFVYNDNITGLCDVNATIHLTVLPPGNAGVKYVTTSGAGLKDGSSWGNAIDTLGFQPHLDSALAGTEFWVAAGLYKPTYGLVETITFNIPDSVKVFGGFNGTESSFGQRDYANNITILDGSLGNPSDTDNVNRIVTFNHVSQQTVLDGFTLQNAYNNNPAGFPAARGGAIYIDGSYTGTCKPVIANCILQNNQSTSGAGAYSNASNNGEVGEHFINCVFRNNISYISHGGAYRSANLNGGIIEPTFDNCIFENNAASQTVAQIYGGAMYFGTEYSALGGIRLRINGCNFYGNSAFIGGAIYIQDDSNTADSVTVSNCKFYGNSAVQGSAFMNQNYVNGNGYIRISGCTVKGNYTTDTSAFNNGAISIYSVIASINASIDNCLITGNRSQFGSGISLFGGPSLLTNITNTTITGNAATGFGGGIGILSLNNGDVLNLNIHNSIIWGNSSSIQLDTGTFQGTHIINVDNSIIEGGYAGTNILNTDPMFVAPVSFTNAPDTSGNFELQAASPAINSGNNSFVISASDLNGNNRIYNGTVDMGCFENGSAPLHLIQPTVAEHDFLIYPNPAHQELIILNNNTNILYAEIYDITGRCLMNKLLMHQTFLNISSLANGLYVIKLLDEHREMIARKKFVKND